MQTIDLLKNKDLVKLLKLSIGKNHPKEELNYALYDFKNKKIVVTDSRNMIIVNNIELYNIEKSMLIALSESKTKLLTVDLNYENYPNYERVIPTNFINSYDSVYELLHDNTHDFPIFNKDVLNMLSNINSKKYNSKYKVNKNCFYVDFNCDSFDCKLIIYPIYKDNI